MQSRLGRLAQFEIADLGTGRVAARLLELGFGLLCFGLFVSARLSIDLYAPSAGPFALIYPFTLIATLFGTWRAGVITYTLAFGWTWEVVGHHILRPHVAGAVDAPRTLVNALSAMVVLLLAELFRAAVQRAAQQRWRAINALTMRETELRELNQDLERQVAERARELGQTWALTPDMLGVVNPQGFFESSNPAWQTILGWPEEVIRTTPFADLVHPDDLERTFAAWEMVKRGDPVLRFENRYRTQDGDWCWLSWIVLPQHGKFYCSARDVTADVAARADLAVAEDALRQAQKLEAVGQLTGGVAHDFNNLLTVIIGAVEMLRRDGLSEARRISYIEAIGDTAQRAARLTGQLLAFARRQALDPVLFDAGESLREVATMIRALTGSRIVLDLQLPNEVQHIRADRSQFDTAMVNMCINARDAMKGEGRLTIAVARANAPPSIRTHPPVTGDFVAVTITDTGEGIAADAVDRIFEPFFTTKGVGEGTGLGLSQVFGFAKQSGGDIAVASTAGKGAAFTLYLPRAEPVATVPSSATTIAADPGLRDGAGACVLVVEDNAQVGEFASAALRELGYRTVLAANAAAALVELDRGHGRFRAVFSDVVMPGMNGIDLAAEIRRRYPGVPVILTSGYSDVLAQRGNQGFELLRKPYSIAELSRILHKAIANGAGLPGSLN